VSLVKRDLSLYVVNGILLTNMVWLLEKASIYASFTHFIIRHIASTNVKYILKSIDLLVPKAVNSLFGVII
jgi:hypothetical protein